MKKQQFGEKEFLICENEFDINDGRFMMFKQYFKQLQCKEDYSNFWTTFEKWKALVNKGNKVEADVCWFDYAKMIQIADQYDAWEFCFALICNEATDDQTKPTDENFMKEKIDYLRTCSEFNRGLVRTEVENFILACKDLSITYMVTKMLMAEILNVP